MTRDGVAEVSRTDAEAGVRLDADTLGALHLGGVATETLRRAGRVIGPGVDTFAAMADTGPAPYCLTFF